ncbi:hypothetical protein C8Q79DRAFT_987548 [Trametes meyenii]|nr:hypothetical protein C8Q79DRAFT_987548 [Trametes meyenii]
MRVTRDSHGALVLARSLRCSLNRPLCHLPRAPRHTASSFHISMARATAKGDVSASESDGEPTSAKRQNASTSKNGTKGQTRADDDAQQESDEEDDGDEEEYEIEKILDAKHGTFPEGRMGYLVKWKGYGEEHNSWVDEKDAEGAMDLITEYWRTHKKGGRKPEPKPKSAPKPRKSSTKADSDVEEVASSTAGVKKRGRQSKVAEPPETDEDEDEEPAPKQKKPRKSTGAAAKGSGRRKSGADEDELKEVYANMRKFKDTPSWEHLIDTIDTVERTESGELVVYFTLKNNKGHGREMSEVCKKKMPYKLIDFYESNLRWKMTDEAAMQE